MPWIEIGPRNFNWSPKERGGRVTIEYKAGRRYLVTTPCATEALAKGMAVRVRGPRKEREVNEWQNPSPQGD